MPQHRTSPKDEASAGAAASRADPRVIRAEAVGSRLLERTRELLGSVGRQMAVRRRNLDRLNGRR
jgi:hypothetical protein